MNEHTEELDFEVYPSWLSRSSNDKEIIKTNDAHYFVLNEPLPLKDEVSLLYSLSPDQYLQDYQGWELKLSPSEDSEAYALTIRPNGKS